MARKYEVIFWQDENGYSESQEYIYKLKEKSLKSKDARIKLNKIVEYIDILETFGTQVGEPYIKHLEGELYELRPIRDRFFFFYKQENKYIILNHFVKMTQKTPRILSSAFIAFSSCKSFVSVSLSTFTSNALSHLRAKRMNLIQ